MPSDPHVGTVLGPYRIESVIGRGGMGVVYLATHTGLARKVALKLLTPDFADDEAHRERGSNLTRLQHLAARLTLKERQVLLDKPPS